MKRLFFGSLLLLAACSQGPQAQDINDSSGNGIIGGQLTDASDPLNLATVQIFTLQVGTKKDGSQGVTGIAGCTGTIVAQDVIVSAAHCTAANPKLTFIYFSTQSPKDLVSMFNDFFKDATLQPNLRQVNGGMTNEKWPQLTGSKVSDWGDISLFKFPGGIPSGFIVAKLAPASLKLTRGETVTLAGYGITDGTAQTQTTGLRKVDVQIDNPNYSVSEMMLDTTHGRGSCHGDSGGPAYVTEGSDLYLVGLTSRADFKTDPKGLCIGKTIYTSVQAYLDWIARGIATLEDPNFKIGPIAQPAAMSAPAQKIGAN